MPSFCVPCVRGTPCTRSVRMFSVIRYCTCTVMIFLKSCVEHSTVLMCVHYTSCIDSYEALQKRSFKKPWYCLDVQSYVSYFANIIMCRICLFCKLHPLHHPLHSCPCPPNSLSSFFLLCFILSPSLPLISGECCSFNRYNVVTR